MYLNNINPYNIEKQHKRDKLHISERIKLLFDKGTFTEMYPETKLENESLSKQGKDGYDGVVTGYGQIEGRKVFFYGQDFTFMGGTFGEKHSLQIVAIIEEALKEKCPVIGIYDGGGARIQEGAASVAGCGTLFATIARASGIIPQIAIVAGTCAGGAVYSPGLADFVFTVEGISNMFVTGAKVINEVCGTDYLIEELGGAKIHSTISGVADFRMENEQKCYEEVRRLVGILPEVKNEDFSYIEKDEAKIGEILPKSINEVYDVRSVINEILDDGTFIEIGSEFAGNMVTGLGRLSGIRVGIVANNTIVKNGSVDVDGCEKAVRLVNFCDAYKIPILTFADATGFVMEAEQEYKGLIRKGARMIAAYARATTVRLTVILRKAYGGPYIFMGCKQLGADKHYVWPKAQVAVMKAEGAVAVISHAALSRLEEVDRKAYLEEELKSYKEKYMNSKMVLERGYVDEEIKPEDTRKILFDDIVACLSGNDKRQ